MVLCVAFFGAPTSGMGMTGSKAFNWDDLRVFMACVEAQSFRQAAVQLGLRPSTVVRRIDRLEQSLGVSVFSRLANGTVLTEEGRHLVKSASRFSEGEAALLRDLAEVDTTQRGTVKIAATDGLGCFWVAPKLVNFQRANPMMIVDLGLAHEAAKVASLAADIAIQLERPSAADVVCKKLGRLHIYTFASKKYLSVYGAPASREEMRNHRLVDQTGAQLNEGVWPLFLSMESVEGVVGIRSNSSVATYLAIHGGAGIGALPTYSPLVGADLEPVDIGFQHHMDIWMSYHPEAIKIPRNRKVADWIIRIFDPRTHPWFGDDFIHPAKLSDPKGAVPRLGTVNSAAFGE